MGEDGAVRTVVILGSTGSIGTQALDVIARNRADYEVVGLAAGGSNAALLAEQAAAFDVEVVAIADPEQADVFRTAFAALAPAQSIPQVLLGADGMDEMAALTCDVVLNAITGSIGLRPTLSALSAGRTVALANKESLIVGGPLVKALAGPDQLVPVDSEHSALAQCLRAGRTSEVRRLIITASGGPFLGRTRDQLAAVTAEQALQHPTWSMGPVVTINSATLMNKGLEVIEAHLLFDIAMEAIEVVVHPQSVVHSMVEFVDGSTLAQVSPPDMRLPISLGLAWPARVADASPPNDWSSSVQWDFHPLDTQAFPAVDLARSCGAAGGVAPAVFNAANEVCVSAFLAGTLPFTGIVDTVAQVVQRSGPAVPAGGALTLEDVLTAEAWARSEASGLVSVHA